MKKKQKLACEMAQKTETQKIQWGSFYVINDLTARRSADREVIFPAAIF